MISEACLLAHSSVKDQPNMFVLAHIFDNLTIKVQRDGWD